MYAIDEVAAVSMIVPTVPVGTHSPTDFSNSLSEMNHVTPLTQKFHSVPPRFRFTLRRACTQRRVLPTGDSGAANNPLFKVALHNQGRAKQSTMEVLMAEEIENHRMKVQVDRPVDGDTVRVIINGKSESVRIQGLDTEESRAGGDKPVSPWGKKASEHAATLFKKGTEIILDFDVPFSDPPPDPALSRFRDNFGRLLALVFIDDLDYQEHMISLGYSPYFPKYGNVRTQGLHLRYLAAERKAQAESVGVWNQVAANGSVILEYAPLTAWWALRASVIEDYRRTRAAGQALLNPRVDFEAITRLANEGRQATVFSEFSEIRRLSARKAIIDIGSQAQPFSVFIPDIETDKAQALLKLLVSRYIAGGTAGGKTVTEPRRGYGYVRGRLKVFNNRPEIEVDGPEDISDVPL